MDAKLKERFDSEVKNNQVVVYMKGSPEAPLCGFSARVAGIFQQMGVAFKGVDVIAEPELRDAIKEYSNWPTLPQVFIRGKFIGGCDILSELAENGELKELLK